jgi:hypothetical protein
VQPGESSASPGNGVGVPLALAISPELPVTPRRLRWLIVPLTLVACEQADRGTSDSSAMRAEESMPIAPPPAAAMAARMPGRIAGGTGGKTAIPDAFGMGGGGGGIGGVGGGVSRAAVSVGAPTEIGVPSALAPETEAAARIASAMVIRTGAASVEVTSIDTAVTLVRQLATRVGGYVANSSLQSGRDQQRTATIELKIPAERYPDAVTGLAPLGRVETVTETAEDVGEEFVDVEARIANSRRLEARIVDLLAQRTGKLADVLEVEQELARVREEIERYEGRRRFLRTRAAVSTLTITVHERLPVVARAEGHSPIANAVRAAWRNFVGVLAALIASLGVLVPLGAVVWLVWWLVVRMLSKGRPGSGPVTE